MGLDQSLYKKTYEKRDDNHPVSIEHPIIYTKEEVMYWRKANQIHKWFVDNIQGGVDDCGTYDVPIEKLQELVNLCKEVLENPRNARKLLPTKSGCFFGDVSYSELYRAQLEKTVEKLEEIIPTIDEHSNSLEYSSSW